MAQVKLGFVHSYGIGMFREESDGLKWFRRAAESGSAVGQYYVGRMYARGGLGVHQNEREAVDWFMRAAAATDEESAPNWFELRLARWLNTPPPTRPQVAAMVELGELHASGVGGVRDEVEAERWFRLAADEGSAAAVYNLGVLYALGRGVSRDQTRAGMLLRSAAEQGFDPADEVVYGMAAGSPPDRVVREEGAKLRRQGLHCLERRIKSRGAVDAAEWFRRATRHGDATAENCIGLLKVGMPHVLTNEGRRDTRGDESLRDGEEAVNWFRSAAQQGHAAAQNNLGQMYADGTGVAYDDAAAVKWFRRAAEQGNVCGQTNLALCYANGRGARLDHSEAARWFKEAAAVLFPFSGDLPRFPE